MRPLGSDVCAHCLLDELEGLLVLGNLHGADLQGAVVTGGEAALLPGHVLQELMRLMGACSGGCTLADSRSWSPVALVEAHGLGVAQSPGCSFPVAMDAEGLHYY